jgi:hypothetical protein
MSEPATIAAALRILARDIVCEDGVATLCLHEAANEIDRLAAEVEKIGNQRDVAVAHIAAWCVAIEQNGTGWDDWDEFYKDAVYRESSLPEIRRLLTQAIEKERSLKGGAA